MGNPTDQPTSEPRTGSTALEVAEFIGKHGDRWELGARADLGVFFATARPTPTSSRTIAARSIGELEAKVEAAEDGE